MERSRRDELERKSYEAFGVKSRWKRIQEKHGLTLEQTEKVLDEALRQLKEKEDGSTDR